MLPREHGSDRQHISSPAFTTSHILQKLPHQSANAPRVWPQDSLSDSITVLTDCHKSRVPSLDLAQKLGECKTLHQAPAVDDHAELVEETSKLLEATEAKIHCPIDVHVAWRYP